MKVIISFVLACTMAVIANAGFLHNRYGDTGSYGDHGNGGVTVIRFINEIPIPYSYGAHGFGSCPYGGYSCHQIPYSYGSNGLGNGYYGGYGRHGNNVKIIRVIGSDNGYGGGAWKR